MQKAIIALVAIILIGIGAYWYFQSSQTATNDALVPPTDNTTQEATTTAQEQQNKDQAVVSKSVEGRDITAYHFGTGDKEILFVGGIHGGYEWNTALVAYELMDYLKANPTAIPANVKVTVIPVLNPDGLKKVVSVEGKFVAADVNPSTEVQVTGRFNGNTVDLNRNFDCDWKATGVWQNKKVSGGSAAFSEPESAAIKSYVESAKPAAVVAYYSSAGGVYASNCHGDLMPETKSLTAAYAKASGYPGHDVWNYYETTGDMTNWLAKMDIPAISVLLTNHTDTEWSKNQAGVDAILKHFAQ